MNFEFERLRDIERKIEPYLQEDEYTFIGPVDRNLVGPFIKNANDILLHDTIERYCEKMVYA